MHIGREKLESCPKKHKIELPWVNFAPLKPSRNFLATKLEDARGYVVLNVYKLQSFLESNRIKKIEKEKQPESGKAATRMLQWV